MSYFNKRRIKMFTSLLQIIFVLTSIPGKVMLNDEIALDRWIKLGMNQTVNPCIDFYSYACGSWNLNRENVGYGKEFNYFSISERSMSIQAIDILKQKVRDKDNIQLIKEKKWFHACMNVNSLYKGKNKFENIVNEGGGFLLVEDGFSNTTGRKWQYVAVHYAGEFAESVFFDIGLNQDNLLKLDIPLTRNREFLHKTNMNVSAAVELIHNKLIPEEKFKNQSTSKELLIKLTTHVIRFIEYIDGSMQIMTIHQFQDMYDLLTKGTFNAKINWLEYLQRIIQNTGMTLKDSDEIEVNIRYLKFLCALLFYTPNEIIVNYIHFMTIIPQHRNWLISSDFMSLLSSKKQHMCFTAMPIQDGVFEVILRRKLKKKNEWVKIMFERLRSKHIEEVKKSWISNNLKNISHEFLKSLDLRWHDYTNPYSSEKLSYEFNINICTLQNIINFNKAQIKYRMEIYVNRKKNQRTKRIEIASFNLLKSNKVSVAPQILLLPVFNISAPISWNLGNVGFILSHKISLAVIKEILKYADDKTKISFAVRVSYFVNRVKNTSVLQPNMMLENDLIQNLANYQGLLVAFKMLVQNQSTINSRYQSIHGLNFTAKELFFISLATTFCGTCINFGHILRMNYLPKPQEIIKAAGNLVEFEETFNC